MLLKTLFAKRNVVRSYKKKITDALFFQKSGEKIVWHALLSLMFVFFMEKQSCLFFYSVWMLHSVNDNFHLLREG